MPFNWPINIKTNASPPPPAVFDPQQQTGVAQGDEIIWSNNDRQAHWPGLLQGTTINQTYFMPTQIAPHSTSPTYNVTEAPGTTINYACSLHPQETGSVVVS